MICPECRAEYREGFYTCADCNVALISSDAAAAGTQPDARFDEHPGAPFHTTHDSVFLALLVDALETAGIPYAFEAGTALDLLVGEEVDETPGLWEARLQVHREHRGRAREILEEVTAQVKAGLPAGPAGE